MALALATPLIKYNNAWWKKIADNMLDQNWRTSFLKLSVPYEKDTTIRSDSKQRTMSMQDWMELVQTESDLQFEKKMLKLRLFLSVSKML